jgi:hypothetical protein
MTEEENVERLRKLAKLNDEFRARPSGRRLVMTAGIACLDRKTRVRVIEAVENFCSFSPENDPFGERNLGFFRLGDQGFFWRIDYYDPTYRRHSDDPSDPTLTIRVMTLMLAEEYC